MNKTGLNQVSEHWQAIPQRTRWLLAGAGLLCILGGIDTYLTDPLRKKIYAQQADSARMLATMATRQKQIDAFKAGNSDDPLTLQVQAMQQDVQAQAQVLAEINQKMVPAEAILSVVKSLLAQHPDVRVIQLKSLSAVDFFEKHRPPVLSQSGVDNSEKEVSGVFQHSIQLKLEGSYGAITAYVADLKHLDAVLGWEHAEMKTQYPLTQLSLEVYTLSRQPVWLGI